MTLQGETPMTFGASVWQRVRLETSRRYNTKRFESINSPLQSAHERNIIPDLSGEKDEERQSTVESHKDVMTNKSTCCVLQKGIGYKYMRYCNRTS